jgi:hypothetical protein
LRRSTAALLTESGQAPPALTAPRGGSTITVRENRPEKSRR